MAIVVDIFLFIFLALGAYNGFKRGFIVELFSIGSLFIATIVSIKLLDKFMNLSGKWCSNLGSLMPYVLFILIFILVIVMITLIGKFLKNLINLTILGSIDKLAGAILGIFKWSFIISGFVWVADLLHVNLPSQYTDHAILFPIIQEFAPKIIPYLFNWLPTVQHWFKHSHALRLKPTPV